MRRLYGYSLMGVVLIVGCQDRSVYRSGQPATAKDTGTNPATALTPPGNTATGRAAAGESRQETHSGATTRNTTRRATATGTPNG